MIQSALKLKAAQLQIQKQGRALLHIKPDGTTEWLWGQFKSPNEKGLSANDFDFTVQVPVIRMMHADAVNVCTEQRRSHFDQASASRIRVSGFEYTVTNRHPYDNGTVHIELAKDCKPVLTPMAIPQCNDGCETSDNSEPAFQVGPRCDCLKSDCGCRYD